MKLLLLPSIGYQIFYYLPIHQRFASEEIHLQISSVSGICNQEIQSLFSHLIAHQSPAAMVLSFLSKTIAAGQVAIVGDVQAERLYHCRTLFKVNHLSLIGILCKQGPLSLQLLHVIQRFPDLFLCPAVFQLFHNLFPGAALIKADHLISQLIHHMDRSAVHIQYNVITVVIITMYHFFTPYVKYF